METLPKYLHTRINHCIDNYIPDVLHYAEMYEIAGLIALRALFVESGTENTIFTIEATIKRRI